MEINSGKRVLSRCSAEKTEINSEKRGWSDKLGKSYYLRGKWFDKDYSIWEFCLFYIPTDLLHECFLIQKNNKDNKQEDYYHNINNNNKIVDHSIFTHTFGTSFLLSHIDASLPIAGLDDTSWVVLGSTFYFFGVSSKKKRNDKILYLERNAAGTIFPDFLQFQKAGSMISKRRSPKVAALDNKVYVFGDNKDAWGEVFEPYPHRFEGCSRSFSSPIQSSGENDILFVVAVEKEKSIVLGVNCKSTDEEVVKLFVYNVVEDIWVERDTSIFLVGCPSFQPVAVDSWLYWVDTKVRAYDLSSGKSYEGHIDDFVFDTHGFESKASLFHLDTDYFCITWLDHHHAKVLHATTIHVMKTTTKVQDGLFELQCRVFACQTFASTIPLVLQDRTLLL